MQFTIDRNSLLKPLGHIYSIVERRNTIPILSNVLIETNSSKISLTATDMDMDIVEVTGCIVSKQGKATLSAHTLYDIVRKLPDGAEIKIELLDLNVEVSAGKSKFTLPTLPVDDYPVMTEIEKGIMIANLGFNPMNNGESIIINVPPLTEERRKELAKMAKAEAENAKVSIRNARKDANQEIKKSEASEDMQKNTEIDVQTATDGFIQKIDAILAAKEKEIMTV